MMPTFTLTLYTSIMHRIRYISFVTLAFCFVYGCSDKNQPKKELVNLSSIRKIDVPDKITRDEISDVIELDSYIPLSNEVLLGQVERVIIHGERIYILDSEPKIVCFNMQGKAMFKIDCKGAGPSEYLNMKDFSIDCDTKRIVVFDNMKRKLFFYELGTGKYISDIPAFYIAPTQIGIVDGSFFFKNMDVRFDVQKDHMFYLLYSKNGKQVDRMFLPHDAVADFSFDMNSFCYNEGHLFFIRPFDNIVYALEKEKITPVFEISLPNPLPLKRIEEKMNHIEIPTSGYSYGIDDLFIAGEILHFTFSKDGFIVSNFFNLSTGNLIYSGIRVLGNAREQLPIYSLINGVYKGKFFALVSASSVVERRAAHPEFFPDDLLKIKEDDNDILAFFTFRDPYI